jgi:hypothetical protein
MRIVVGGAILVAAVILAAPVGATPLPTVPVPLAPLPLAPRCMDTAPNTRFCQTPGHSQITTSPDPAMTNSYPGWGFGSLGFGQGGIWFGF